MGKRRGLHLSRRYRAKLMQSNNILGQRRPDHMSFQDALRGFTRLDSPSSPVAQALVVELERHRHYFLSNPF